jgi:hypothetical protein
MNKNILVEKFNLVDSATYKRIKELQLENILRLANSDIEPLVLKGMLKNIADTDKWENEFMKEKRIKE